MSAADRSTHARATQSKTSLIAKRALSEPGEMRRQDARLTRLARMAHRTTRSFDVSTGGSISSLASRLSRCPTRRRRCEQFLRLLFTHDCAPLWLSVFTASS
eukprot:2193446-Pleurochrysis_carterae.AAC.1